MVNRAFWTRAILNAPLWDFGSPDGCSGCGLKPSQTVTFLKSGRVTLSLLCPPKNELALESGLSAEQAETREVPAWAWEPPGFSGSR